MLLINPRSLFMARRSEIITAIRNIHTVLNENEAVDDSLLRGSIGLVLYYSVIPDLTDKNDGEKSILLLNDIFERIENEQSTLGTCLYANGLSGLGTALQLLVDAGTLNYNFDEGFKVVDDFIFEEDRFR